MAALVALGLAGSSGSRTAVLALVAAGQGVALVPQLAAGGRPAGVILTPLSARRRTRIAYRKGTRHHPIRG
jgi:DNA-binding transcriptional LysR family regulator